MCTFIADLINRVIEATADTVDFIMIVFRSG